MQTLLFENIEAQGLTINETADEISVSSATIRNWIKTGYLKETNKGIIDKISLDKFLKDIAGKEKLTTRANKLMKDSHNHIELSKQLHNHNDSWENVGAKYENSLSNSYRNKEGIYYTPNSIVKDMLKTINITSASTFLDPCCGSGNFILQAIRNGIKPENVFGFDIDANAVEITRKRIWEETGFNAECNIQQLDFLENASIMSNKNSYDFIFTNPPWGKKIKKAEKERLANTYKAGKSTDTTSLFYFASLQLLKPNGILGFLVQEALFNISTFQHLRQDVLNQKLIQIIDYGKAFKGLLTNACAFIIEKSDNAKNQVRCEIGDIVFQREQKTFNETPKSILNFWTTKEECETIKYIYDLPHKTLEKKAKWALGIVTGNNSKYCKKQKSKNHIPVYKGADITAKGLKSASNYIPNDFSLYQQVAPISLYQAPEKLIYKFISSKLTFYCDSNQRFILNSANLLIPDKILGVTCQQLADLLSSDFMNWVFYKLFRTHKILRGDIEQLPLHIEYFREYDVFSEDTYIDFLGLIKEKDGTYRIKK